MKKPNSNFGRSGLTLVEVLIIFVVVAVLVAMLLPASVGGGRSKIYLCENKLRQIDVCFIEFANDNGDKFPMQLPWGSGGTMVSVYTEDTFPHFEILKRYGLEVRTCVCPFETNRQAAASFEALNDLNLSYFVNVDASVSGLSHTILTGDRFLQVNRQPVAHGVLNVTTNLHLSWTPNFHTSRGNFAFTDGSVEISRDDGLASLIASQPLATNRFSIP